MIPIGRARSARYGLLKSIHGATSQQPIWWTTESGEVQRLGTLSFLDGDLIHVAADFGERRSKGGLPWFLAPLRARGQLIGNTDMHSGNLGVMVAAADLGPGRFTLAPVYHAADALAARRGIRRHARLCAV